jgi:hypothetical protein
MLCLRLPVLAAVLAGGWMISLVQAWELAPAPLETRWTKEVSPANALPEYPRPQMARKSWVNLNGLWQYAIRPAAEEKPVNWDGEILVPFAVESALSGVKKAVTPDEQLWYRRKFESPKLEDDGRLLLHFGAVDWKCTVWINGKQVGEHTGGFNPFTFDITDALNSGDTPNEVVVAVSDPTDTSWQPRGKQVLRPHGIFYTAVTGIWQTVWLEPVPKVHIKSLKIVPDIDRSVISVTADAPGADAVRIRINNEGRAPDWVKIAPGKPAVLFVSNPVLWSPDRPHLYDLRVECLVDDKVADAVDSYFGMRKIDVKKDKDGINRLWLNNKVVFQYGPLDQGWWPDGLYTAPTDEALKYDIEMTKRLGFNMARKHVKVEPARWYYWCDKLGLLVWQDMVSGDAATNDESKKNYRKELKSMIDALHNHPSIVMWVPFNEGWGQYDTEEVAAWTQKYDPTRPVNEASGWHDKGSGDVADMHNYPGPGMREPEEKRVSVLGEFGGLGMPVRGHTWQDEKNWGYVSYDSADALTGAYVELLTMLRPMIGRGLSAAVYTQTTDVEIEVNGLLTYDRALVKMEEARITEAAKKLYQAPPEMRILSPTSEFTPNSWRYTLERPDDRWFEADFEDDDWQSGSAGFGAGELPRAVDVIRTPWKTPEIWIRRTFEIDGEPASGQLMLLIQHDEDAEVYLNGQQVKAVKGHMRHYKPVLLDEAAAKHLRKGRNTLAVHCRQTTGGQYIDAGLVQIAEQ